MDLKISKKHARYARRGNETSCPAARAFKDAGFKDVHVDGSSVSFATKDDDMDSHPLPETLAMAIEQFDGGKPFKLGTYRIAGLKRPTK